MSDNAKFLFGWVTFFVCLWPFCFFMSVFAFDEPSRGFLDDLIRPSMVLVLLTYPWGYVVACFARKRAKKNGTDWWTPRTIRFLIAPFIHFGVVNILGVLDSVFVKHG
ncbi:MAG TPA: hypothetical protein VG347_17725 [Verrucomicrobiae bacterium]|nr:hypothetical protein [Verrucomicrobiae bacterium]